MKVETCCANCGVILLRYPSQLSTKNFCDRACQVAWKKGIGNEEFRQSLRGPRPSIQGENNPMYGKQSKLMKKRWQNKDYCQHMSIAISNGLQKRLAAGDNWSLKGAENPRYGTQRSQEECKRISEGTQRAMATPEIMKKMTDWGNDIRTRYRGANNPNYRGGDFKQCATCGQKFWVTPCLSQVSKYCSRRCLGIATLRKVKHTPNLKEKQLESILNQHFAQEWQFVGDGSMILGGLNPDFINCNSKKLIIELFGDYWHSDKKVRTWRETELGRMMVFAQFGYKTLVVWEHELDKEEDVVHKIQRFIAHAQRKKR